MNTRSATKAWGDFMACGLCSDETEVWIVPELGARIVSLLDRRSGREWVWSPEGGGFPARARCGDSFVNPLHGGIDECLPTIGACAWRGRSLPDHGEVWSAEWQLDADAFARGQLDTTVTLPVSPFIFSRSLTLEGDELTLRYQLTNRSRAAEPFVWAWHPLFALRAGDTLQLPEGTDRLRLEIAVGAAVGHQGAIWRLPVAEPGFDLAHLTLGSNRRECVKGFVGPLAGERVSSALCGAGGESLTVTWSPHENPLLGVWLSRGFANCHHLALEPTNGAPDRLDLAVEDWRQHGTLAPHETRPWSLRVRLAAAR